VKPVKKLIRFGVAAAAAAAATLVGAGTPAQAAVVESTCGTISGSAANKTTIYLCAGIKWIDPFDDPWTDFTLVSRVLFDENATSATNCKVTMYVELKKPGSDVWTSPKNVQNCQWAVDHPGELLKLNHQSSESAATYGRAHACIDLYYNHSSSSGWQRCQVGDWEDNDYK